MMNGRKLFHHEPGVFNKSYISGFPFVEMVKSAAFSSEGTRAGKIRPEPFPIEENHEEELCGEHWLQRSGRSIKPSRQSFISVAENLAIGPLPRIPYGGGQRCRTNFCNDESRSTNPQPSCCNCEHRSEEKQLTNAIKAHPIPSGPRRPQTYTVQLLHTG